MPDAERLAVVFPEDEKLEISDVSEVKQILEKLKSSLEKEDYDSSDVLGEKLQKYLFTEDMTPLVEKLSNQILLLETEEALESIDTIRTRLGD